MANQELIIKMKKVRSKTSKKLIAAATSATSSVKKKKSYKLSKRSLKRLTGIKPILIDILKESIKESPWDFGVPREGGFRSADEQHILFLKGASKCDGYKKKSYHQTGKAFDIYIYFQGKASWDREKLKDVAKHIMKVAKEKFNVKLSWGGNWRFKDLPHFQIK